MLVLVGVLLSCYVKAQCDPDQALPSSCLCIYLCHSSATAQNNCGVTVNWTVGFEGTSDYYEIYRSPNSSTSFTKIATIQSNPSNNYSYSYSDNNPSNSDGGDILYYVKMISGMDGSVKSQTPVRTAKPTCALPNSCSGITTTTNLTGNAGDVIVLRLSFGGYVNWNGIANGAGASIQINCANQSGMAGSDHYYGSGSFSLSKDITITMPSNTATVTTLVTVNNSTTMLSSTATLLVVSVNGISQTTQAVVCGGNSQGYW